MKTSIKEVSLKLQEITNPDDSFLTECQNDDRKGVVELVNKWYRVYEKDQALRQHFINMSQFEKRLYQQGFSWIAGIDEVGRGPLAGPVVASAVILPETFYLPGINDSKKLSEAKREQFYERIIDGAIAIGTGVIHNDEIDDINIYQATKKAMISAVSQLSNNQIIY